MLETRRVNLEKSGRHLVAALCILTLALAGCVKDKPVATTEDVVQQQAEAQAPSQGLGDYIRTVFKLQQQGPPEARSEVERLHQAKPDLAALAEKIQFNPTDVEARRELAAAYLEEGLLTEAYRLLEELRAVGTRSASLEIGLAEIWDQWGNFPLAHRHAANALDLEGDNHRAWTMMGRIQLHRGEFESASQAFAKALELGDAEDAYLLASLGYAHFKLGDWRAARPFLEAALEADDSLVEVHNNLGITLAQLREDELALTHFRAVAEEKVAYNNLGVVQMERGDWVAAHSAFQQALMLDPDYGKAAFNLAEAESYLPAPSVIDVGGFGTPASVRVATVAAAPREASTAQLASLPTSGTIDLPAWPRTFSPLGQPAVGVASSRRVLASVEAVEPLGLPLRSRAESWLGLTVPVALAELPADARPETQPDALAESQPVAAERSVPLSFGFERQLEKVSEEPQRAAVAPAPDARKVEETSVPTVAEEASVAPAGEHADVAEAEETAVEAPRQESVAAETRQPAPVEPARESQSLAAPAPIEARPAAEAASDSYEAGSETVAEPAPEPRSVPVPAVVQSDLAPVETGSSAGRLAALLAIVGLGVAAGSLTAGRFWGLVGGLVGALAAAFTTLLRG